MISIGPGEWVIEPCDETPLYTKAWWMRIIDWARQGNMRH